MNHDDNEDPDSGHPTPRDYFNPDEATTSTPIPARRKASSIRSNSFAHTQSFSPRNSSRLSNSHPNPDEYGIVNDVIEMVKRKKHVEEENELMKNQSMISEYELEQSKTRIAVLEEQLTNWTFDLGTIDVEGRNGEEAPSGSVSPEEDKWKEEAEMRWMEERRRIEKEKEDMEGQMERLREELDSEKNRVNEMKEWQLKYEMLETEKELIVKRTANAIERNDALLKEKEEEIEKLKERMGAMERISISSDSNSLVALEREMQELKGKVAEQELNEIRDEGAEEKVAIDNLRRLNKELEEKLKSNRTDLDELHASTEVEKRKMRETVESEKEGIMKRASSIVERAEGQLKEKEDELREEVKRRLLMEERIELDRIKDEKMDEEMIEMRRKLREYEDIMDGMKEDKIEMERVSEKNEKECEQLRKKVEEMERALSAASTEEFRIRDLERLIRDLEKKITVADQSLIDSIKHCEELKSIREGEMAETLELKTKVHEQISTIDILRRINGELEERRKESLKTMEELKSKTTEGTRLMSEMEELRNDVERRRERQKRLEDELDIARKMTEDANREVNRVREEKEKEKEQRRMEWMNGELRDSEDLKKKMEKEREESEIQLREALAEVTRYHHLYEELKEQYHDFQAGAQHQYTSELEAKEEELAAMRDRLAEVENYPGKFVSIDGRFSEGRSLNDILPIQLKEFVGHITDEEVMRAVECCKNMVIRGGQMETREEREGMTPTPSYLSILIERLEDMEMLSSLFKEYRDFVVGVFKQMNETERTEELMTSLASKMEVKMSHLEEEWIEMEKRNDRNGERLRKGEEERNRLEDEAIRADDARKKAMNELMDLREKIVQAKAEKDTYQEAAIGFQLEYEKRCSELEEADETVEQLNERCHQLTDDVNEKERRIRLLMEESNDLEKKLEDEIVKNSSLSRQLVAESTKVHDMEDELRRKKKESDKLKSNKEKMHSLIRELMDAMNKHFRVYKRVKGRNEQRQVLLDRAVSEIAKTRMTIGGSEILETLEKTIFSEITDFLAGDARDYKESDDIQSQIDFLEDKENR